MKKTSVRKLVLNRQTLRRLDALALAQVAGGTSPGPAPKPSTWCSMTGPAQCISRDFACTYPCR